MCFVHWEWAVFGGGMAMVFSDNLMRGAISALGVVSMVVLAGFTIGVLYFMRSQHRRSMLRTILPPRPLHLQHYAALAGIFLLAAALGYSIPAIGGEEEPAQATVIIMLLYLSGFLWLPATSIIMAVRAFVDLSRMGF